MELDRLKIKKIISLFKIDEEIIDIRQILDGHINVTYYIKCNKESYILQKINNKIFPNVDGLMNNIELITNYIRNKIIDNDKDYGRKTLTIIKSKDNKNYIRYENGFYRVYKYINNSIAFQIVENEFDFYKCGKAFGGFYKLLDGFDASKLVETIPNFHNTLIRYKDFLKAVKEDRCNKAKDCKKEIEFITSREHYYSKLVNMIKDGKLPLRVTHNDTKLNNILFDKDSKEALSIIDLDTVMPGSICYDFGDAIRFGCNPCLEDEKDLTKVNFQFNLYKVFLKGFLESLGNTITKEEKECLSIGSILMTIECGMRFLADYLNGDVYFHINREGQNLDRCRTQLKLVEDMEKIIDKMNSLIE